MNKILFGDCRATMRSLIAQGVKVQTCVTSPPYFGLRDYGHAGQLGLEETPELFVSNLVEVFNLVRDLLADDGTLWLNLGDSYAGSGKGVWNASDERKAKVKETYKPSLNPVKTETGLEAKNLIGIPWRVAFALQADGWYLRQDIIWHKPNPMPESVTDRCTKAHEYIFLLSKSPKYFFNAEANQEKSVGRENFGNSRKKGDCDQRQDNTRQDMTIKHTRNRRSVWTVATKPYKGAHFATFPADLITPCVLAGSRPGDIVFDPFMGSGTTAQVALENGRQYIGCELNEEYGKLQQKRLNGLQRNLII